MSDHAPKPRWMLSRMQPAFDVSVRIPASEPHPPEEWLDLRPFSDVAIWIDPPDPNPAPPKRRRRRT